MVCTAREKAHLEHIRVCPASEGTRTCQSHIDQARSILVLRPSPRARFNLTIPRLPLHNRLQVAHNRAPARVNITRGSEKIKRAPRLVAGLVE